MKAQWWIPISQSGQCCLSYWFRGEWSIIHSTVDSRSIQSLSGDDQVIIQGLRPDQIQLRNNFFRLQHDVDRLHASFQKLVQRLTQVELVAASSSSVDKIAFKTFECCLFVNHLC